MIRVLLAALRPFAAIAQELRIIRELMELDLASRNPPIWRATEKPSRGGDTEVSYAGVRDDRPGWKLWHQVHEEDEE